MRELSKTQQFEAAYRQHRGAVLRWSLRYGAGSRAWAEDVVQEVFVKLHRHFEHLDLERELAGWLFRTTATTAISRLRHEKSLWGRMERALWAAPTEAPAPDELAEARQNTEGVWRAIEQLEGPLRVVLSMKLLDGLSQQEIAEAMGWSKGYVSKLVGRAWAQLKAQGWEVPDGEA